jgi:hypothetical protein
MGKVKMVKRDSFHSGSFFRVLIRVPSETAAAKTRNSMAVAKQVNTTVAAYCATL